VLEKVERMAWLMDFYGPLLTERQKRIMQLYYDNDWSLGEIAENYEVSRQAIYDVLRRAEKALEQYESRLGLVEKFKLNRRRLNMACELLKEIKNERNEDRLEQIRDILEQVLENEGS
jgi:predicted DNA-binding protein YlxM (UPF0122 family)